MMNEAWTTRVMDPGLIVSGPGNSYMRRVRVTDHAITYITPSFLPTLLHLLCWPHFPEPEPSLGLSRGLEGAGLLRPLPRPPAQCEGEVQPGLNQPKPSLVWGELRTERDNVNVLRKISSFKIVCVV